MDCKMGSEHCVNARQMVFKWLTLGLFRAQALNIYTGKEMLFPPSIFSITDQCQLHTETEHISNIKKVGSNTNNTNQSQCVLNIKSG